MFFNQIDETPYSFALGNVEFHCGFSDVEIDLPWCSADVAEISVCHFTRAIDNAAHDCDSNAFKMACRSADFLSGGLKVEQGASAGRAGDVIRFENPGASCL